MDPTRERVRAVALNAAVRLSSSWNFSRSTSVTELAECFEAWLTRDLEPEDASPSPLGRGMKKWQNYCQTGYPIRGYRYFVKDSAGDVYRTAGGTGDAEYLLGSTWRPAALLPTRREILRDPETVEVYP